MEPLPEIELITDRLVLRPVRASDEIYAGQVFGDFEVAKWLVSVPHPYPVGGGEAFVQKAKRLWASGKEYIFAIVPNEVGRLCGTISIRVDEGGTCEIGYCLGHEYWRNGFVTEAALALLDWGSSNFSVKKIRARHFVGNDASAKVLLKCGLRYTGETSKLFSMSLDREVENLWMELERHD